MPDSSAEQDRRGAKLLDHAALLIKLAARQRFAGARKPAAVTLAEALELIAEYQDTRGVAAVVHDVQAR